MVSQPYVYQRHELAEPEAGQAWWRTERSQPRADSGKVVSLANATG